MSDTKLDKDVVTLILPKETMEQLESNYEDFFIISRWMYSIGKDIITDSKYNLLREYLIDKELLPEYTSRTWSEDPCPVNLLKKYNLDDSIESIVVFKDSASIPSITTWEDLRYNYLYMGTPHRLSFKKDGFNFHVAYVDGVPYKGNTRGRTGKNLEFRDLSDFNIPQRISLMGNINVIGELTLSKSNFIKLKQMYPLLNLISQRASVRTALANKEAHKLLTFTAFNIQEVNDIYEEERLLKEWGFTDPGYIWISTYTELVDQIKILSEKAKTVEDLTDGIVIENISKDKQRAIRLGFWQESILRSYVISYKEEPGNFNDIPKLVVRRIHTDKSGHTLIPITNWGRVISNGLIPGSPVAFKLTSQAAPVIDLGATKILQQQYMGKYALYKQMVDLEEESKFM